MTRFGKVIVGLLLLAVITLGTIVRFRDIVVPADKAVPAPAAAARLMIPVVGVAAAQLVPSFTDPRDGGGRSHGALDIAAPAGTPVVAAAPGLVEKVFESDRGGHAVYLRSADRGTVYYYAHLAGYAPGLREGDYLAQGAAVGFVGATGDADAAAPHLHFEVKRMLPGEKWYQGRDVDPYPLLTRR